MSAQPPGKQRSPTRRSPGNSPGRRPLHRRSSSEINATQGALSSGQNTPTKAGRRYKTTYSTDVFPTLPSQIFSPEEQFETFQDNNGAGRPVLQQQPPRRRSPKRGKSSNAAKRLSAPDAAVSNELWRFDTAVPPLNVPPTAPSAPGTPKTPGSLVSLMRQRYEQADAAARLSQFSFEKGRFFRSAPSSPHSHQAEIVTSPSLLEISDDVHQQVGVQFHEVPEPVVRRPSIPTKSPHRSPSPEVQVTEDDAAAPDQENLPEPDVDGGDGLRRSYSNPAAHTDAFLNALLSDETNQSILQYPIIKKPSSSTIASNSSSIRRAYPAPLRLRKKRANSHLARMAAHHAGNTPRRIPPRSRDGRLQASRSNASMASSANWVAEDDASPPLSSHQRDPSNPNALRWSKGWADEIDDMVPELSPNPLRHQSSFYLDSASTSRVNLDESGTARDSFYYWFNDSHTRWAKAFYRGGGKLPLEAPPSVTMINEPAPVVLMPSSSYSFITPMPSRHNSTSASGPSDSPESIGFPDQIYIPRSRPLRPEWSSVESFQHQPGAESEWESILSLPEMISQGSERHDSFGQHGIRDDVPLDTVRTPSLPEPARLRDRASMEIRPTSADPSTFSMPERTPEQEPSRAIHPSRLRLKHDTRSKSVRPSHYSSLRPSRRVSKQQWKNFNPTPPVPHLSLDRRVGDAIPIWSAPSLDDKPGPFNKLNRQIWLFFLGFVCPFCWMLAAVLPLPPRPTWRSRAASEVSVNEVNERKASSWAAEESAELFDAHEVWRYRKARWWRITNRFMSLTGLCVIAAVVTCAVIGTR